MMIVRVAQLATAPRLVIDPLGRFENEFALVKVGDVVSPFTHWADRCLKTAGRGATPVGWYIGHHDYAAEHASWALQQEAPAGTKTQHYIPNVVHFLKSDDGLCSR